MSEDDDIQGDLSKFTIEKKVGSGEFCDVYRAQYHGETVALKCLKISQMFNSKIRSGCLREIQLLRKLNHPNIVRLIEYFFANNELYIALEYANAGDLSKMLAYFRKKQKYISERNVWNFFSQVCAGLAYMHSQRVMHRDIKPANVLLNRDSRVMLADFGLSLVLSATTDNAQSFVGTPYYMAPERLRESQYNFKADIWSLGCLLYELVTLYSPFFEPEQNLSALCSKISTLNYKPIDVKCSDEIGYIVSHCLLLEPDARADIEVIAEIASRMDRHFQTIEEPPGEQQ